MSYNITYYLEPFKLLWIRKKSYMKTKWEVIPYGRLCWFPQHFMLYQSIFLSLANFWTKGLSLVRAFYTNLCLLISELNWFHQDSDLEAWPHLNNELEILFLTLAMAVLLSIRLVVWDHISTDGTLNVIWPDAHMPECAMRCHVVPPYNSRNACSGPFPLSIYDHII